MTRDDARDILTRWANIDDEIVKAEQAYKKKCDEIDMIASIPSPVQNMTGMPHTKTISKSTERVALRRIEIAEANRHELEALNNRVISAMQFRAKVNDALILCSIDEEKVIECRYKKNMTMIDTAKELLLSERTAWRYEQNVLDTICKTFI